MICRLLFAALGLVTLTANASPPVDTLRAKDARNAEIAAGASGRFALELEAGGFAKLTFDQIDLDVVVAVHGPDGQVLKTFDYGGKGEPELVEFEATVLGRHELVVTAFEPGTAGRYAVRIDEIRNAAAQAAVKRTLAMQRSAATAWIAKHAIALKGAEPGIGIDDLKALDPVVGDASVVLLGEATHGTREFFQLKHRLLEYLVQEKGFNIFAIEATQPEAFRINRYVLEGEGDPAKALAGLYFWTWNTEEVFEMICWMRRYNADPAHTRKLKFYGFDMQSPQLAAQHIEQYLARVDRDAAAQARKQLSVVDDGYEALGFLVESTEVRAQLIPFSDQLLQQFDRNQTAWSRRTSKNDWAVARQHAQVLAQSALMMGSDALKQSSIRAKAMADNLLWIARHEGPDARIVGWAHNGHVSFRPRGDDFETGGHLKAALGDKLRVFGFAFSQGSFQARAALGTAGGLHQFSVAAPPVDALDAMLAGAHLPLAAIDLRTLPDRGPIARWFAVPHSTRSIGSVFDSSQGWGFDHSRVQDDYDALIFVDHTTAARPMPWGTRKGKTALPQAANLDFERGEAGDTPTDWMFSHGDEAFGFRTTLSTEHPHGGRSSALLLRDPGPVYGLAYGQLSQRVDATPYRGQRVRLQGWLRAEPGAGDGRGHLRLSVDVPGPFSWGEPYTRQNFRNPVVASRWQKRSLEADVRADALHLDFGAVLVGEGRLWIDDVAIEVLGPIEEKANTTAATR